MSERPKITLSPGKSRRFRSGHPWIYSNEIAMDAAAKSLPPGTMVTILDAGGEKLGVGSFNPHSLIAIRLFTRDASTQIDATFLATRLRHALALRETLFDAPCYRLIHAEADGLPGLIIDRYGPVLTIQANSAGIELLLPDLLAALDEVLAPDVVLLRNSSPVRKLEGLVLYDRVAKGALTAPVELIENGARFVADLESGQKTGWFYDQRDNRKAVAALSKGRTMIDFYAYAGGFAIQAALAGATGAVAVDRSESALEQAAKAATLNNVSVECRRTETFAEMERLGAAKETFGIVVADPPAFVKSKRDLASGAKGYRKLARLASALVEPGGFLFIASCSHHMSSELFAEEVAHGMALASRSGRILRHGGAGADHPVHPFLPESAYLKSLILQLD